MVQKPQRIAKLGNAAAVSIPRAILHHLGWQLGDLIVVKLREDNTLLVRRPVAGDFLPERLRPFVEAADAEVKA